MKTKKILGPLVVSILLAVGCGDDGGPTTAPSPPPPTRANITISQNGRGLVTVSLQPGSTFLIQIPVQMRESGGVGANINFARLSFQRGGVDVERREIGASRFIEDFGDNRLEANQTENVSLTFRFNVDEFDTLILEMGFTDDRGNNHNPMITLSPADFDFGARAWVRVQG